MSLYNANCVGKCSVSYAATLLNTASYATPFSEFCVFDRNMQNTIMYTYRDQFIKRWHANLECEHSLTGITWSIVTWWKQTEIIQERDATDWKLNTINRGRSQ